MGPGTTSGSLTPKKLFRVRTFKPARFTFSEILCSRGVCRRGERGPRRREPDDVVTANVVGCAAEAGCKIVGVGHRDAPVCSAR